MFYTNPNLKGLCSTLTLTLSGGDGFSLLTPCRLPSDWSTEQSHEFPLRNLQVRVLTGLLAACLNLWPVVAVVGVETVWDTSDRFFSWIPGRAVDFRKVILKQLKNCESDAGLEWCGGGFVTTVSELSCESIQCERSPSSAAPYKSCTIRSPGEFNRRHSPHRQTQPSDTALTGRHSPPETTEWTAESSWTSCSRSSVT